MSRPKNPKIRAKDLQGFKLLDPLKNFLPDLRKVGEHPNREFTFDRYLLLMLLYFFTPALTGLRSAHRATGLKKVQRTLDLKGPISLGSLSEAAHAFAPEELLKIIQSLAAEIPAPTKNPKLRAVKETLVAVDGTVLKALSRMPWALWIDENNRAAKAHVQFDIRKCVPIHSTLTPANTSEIQTLQDDLRPGYLYVLDRGYLSFDLFQKILEADSSFVCRIEKRVRHQCDEVRPLTASDRQAGVISDHVGALGSGNKNHPAPEQPIRIVTVRFEKDDKIITLRLATNRLDLPAETIALIYKHRWDIELFFRWLKSHLKIEHFFGESLPAAVIQFYAAMIATLLLVLYGLKPSKRAYEMLSFYLMGWASEQEVVDFLNKEIQKNQ